MADRTPMHSPEAEQATLGAVIADPTVLPRVAELSEDLFAEPRNRLVLGAVQRLYARGEVADSVSLMDELRGRGALEEAGGAPYLSALIDAVPSAARFDAHVEILTEKRQLRALLACLRELTETAQNGGGRRPLELIDAGVAALVDLGRRSDRGEYVRAGDLVPGVLDEIQSAVERGSAVTGLPTGLGRLDELTAGLHAGQLVIVGGRASVGKTAVAIGMARHAALECETAVGIFSLEMPRGDVVKRILAAEARVPFTRLRSGSLRDDEYDRLAHAAGIVRSAEIIIDDQADLTALELRGRSRRMVERDGVGLVVVDYLQLVHVPGTNGTREQAVSEISRTCKAIARELDIPVVALSQLSRAPMQRSNSRPILSDLRESGAIEQDADVVIFPHRPNREKEHARYPTVGEGEEAELVIGKQRNGETGVVRAVFDGSLMEWRA